MSVPRFHTPAVLPVSRSPLMVNGLAQRGVQVDAVTTGDDGPGKRLHSVMHAEPVACGDHRVRDTADCKIILFLSLVDPKLLEAMACIADKQVGLAEADERRETLAVCDTNVESPTSSICSLLENELLCENRGAQAGALALTHYSVDDMMLHLKRVYELIAKGQMATALPR